MVQFFKRSNPACFWGGGVLGERRGSYLIFKRFH